MKFCLATSTMHNVKWVHICLIWNQTFANNFNPFKPEFTIVIFIHYKPRIAVAILDWQWMKMTWSGWQMKKILLFLKQFHDNFRYKTTRFQEGLKGWTHILFPVSVIRLTDKTG